MSTAASGEEFSKKGAEDPWSNASSPSNIDPWGTAPSPTDSNGTVDWLSTPLPEEKSSFNWSNPFDSPLIPFDHWVEGGIDWMVSNFRPAFQAISLPVDYILSTFQTILQTIPSPLMILIFGLISWQIAGGRMGLVVAFSLVLIGAIGVWEQAMITLALVLTSVFFCLLLGLPLGIGLARNESAARLVRPILDAMQTTPAFVYLIPIVMLFGIGNVPGVVVTIIFALPPIIRLTLLGIRQVPIELIEAATSFGADSRQLLFKVQLPLALPTIMAGVNQTLMLALSMVVIASMIAVGGLGQMVLRGIGRLDMGLAAMGGLGIVLLAIMLDRLTQALGRDPRERTVRNWYQAGPIGLFYRAFSHGDRKN